MADAPHIAAIIAFISAAFPHWEVPKQTVQVYTDLLSDLNAHELWIAAKHACSEPGRRFPPSVGELRGAVMGLRKEALRIPSAYEAWKEVVSDWGGYRSASWCEQGLKLRDAIEAARQDGRLTAQRHYERHMEACEVCFAGGFKDEYSHPAITHVVRRLGGRRRVLRDNETADRARFIEAYTELTDQALHADMLLPEVRDHIRTLGASPAELLDPELRRLTKWDDEAEDAGDNATKDDPPSLPIPVA